MDLNKIIEDNFRGLDDVIEDKDILHFYKGLIRETILMYAQELHYPVENVTRFEVIDHTKEMLGRTYVKYGVQVELSFQDNGQTLKVFVDDKHS
jgi:hypothetical protein